MELPNSQFSDQLFIDLVSHLSSCRILMLSLRTFLGLVHRDIQTNIYATFPHIKRTIVGCHSKSWDPTLIEVIEDCLMRKKGREIGLQTLELHSCWQSVLDKMNPRLRALVASMT